MLLDEGGPNAIRFHPLCMVSSIEFNHQTTFNTTKVGDEWTDRMLSTKLRSTKLACAQSCPEFALSIRLVASRLTSSDLLRAWIREHEIRPHLTLSQGEINGC